MYGTNIKFITTSNGFTFQALSYSKELIEFIMKSFNEISDDIENLTLKEFTNHKKSWNYPAWDHRLMVDFYSHTAPQDAVNMWSNIEDDDKPRCLDLLMNKNSCIDCPPYWHAQTYVPYSNSDAKKIQNALDKMLKQKLQEKNENKKLKFISEYKFEMV